MKLSTYNFLTSMAIKGVKVGYPLKLTVSLASLCIDCFMIVQPAYYRLAKKTWWRANSMKDLCGDYSPNWSGR